MLPVRKYGQEKQKRHSDSEGRGSGLLVDGMSFCIYGTTNPLCRGGSLLATAVCASLRTGGQEVSRPGAVDFAVNRGAKRLPVSRRANGAGCSAAGSPAVAAGRRGRNKDDRHDVPGTDVGRRSLELLKPWCPGDMWPAIRPHGSRSSQNEEDTMKFSKSASVEELQVISRFESLRKILLSEQYADHLKKPLAYWALPTDRRLPLAFLGRTLEDLLNTPFSELSNTPGIGQKKIGSFVKLLARAANTDPAELPTDVVDRRPRAATAGRRRRVPRRTASIRPRSPRWSGGNGGPASVKHGLGAERLGRFAPSLRNMTRVIWNTPWRTTPSPRWARSAP